MRSLRLQSAPAGGRIAVCPHCWQVNPGAERLCARCGADMAMALQESGGLRWTAPVQSPMPVRAGRRLSAFQRWVVLGFITLVAVANLVGAASIFAGRPAWAPAPVRMGGEQ